MWFQWFERLVPPFPEAQPEMPPARLWPFVWHYTKPFRWLLLAAVIISAAMAVVELAIFSFLGTLVDELSSLPPDEIWAEKGGLLIFMGLLVVVAWPLLALVDDSITHQGLLGNFAMQIRWRAHRYLLRQSTQFFTDDFAGRLSTKVMQTALGVREAMMQMTNLFVYVTVYFLGAIVLFGASDWRLTLPIVIWLVAYGTVMRVFLPRLRDLSEEQSDARSHLTGRIVDAYTNIQTVKLFAAQRDEDAYARDGMATMLDTVYRQMRQVTQLSFWLHLINALLIGGTVAMGLWLWSRGEVSGGPLALSVALLMRLQGMSHWFLWEVAGLFESIGAIQDGIETLSRPLGLTDAPVPTALTVTGGKIDWQKVGFHYGKGSGVIDDLSLTIAPGEKVGIVGRSGAGKSTLINLLLRLYDVEKGRIMIDGVNIADVAQEDLRRQISVVTQDTSLMHRSIRDNIAYGTPDASEDAIWRAIERARAADFIPGLVDGKGRRGLDAHVGERGVKLSGGQRQRIAIARIILKDAPILVLDEATSALDSEAEAAIQQQLDALMQGKTVIAIAHRLSTIAAMDRLVIMDQGSVVEEGTHTELIKAGGIYADLWRLQSGGFLGRETAATAAE